MRYRLFMVMPCVAFGLFGGAVPTASARSMPEFLELKSKWEYYAKIGTKLKVEGRYSSISPRMLRLYKCKLPFKPKSLKEYPNLSSTSGRVEVTGRLQNENGQLVFYVDKIQQLPSDIESYYRQKRNLREANGNDWYALGDRTMARGKFYEDTRLQELAKEAYSKGISVEYERLPKTKPQELLDLAAKVIKYDVAGGWHRQFVHEAYRIDWGLLQKEKQPNFSALTERMARHMAGSLVVLPAPQEKLELKRLEQRYLNDPLNVFRSSDEKTRILLHRIFYIHVILSSIERGAKADGSNGYEIAAKIDEQVPEKHDLAENYRDRELDFRLTQIDGYRQSEAIALSKQFQQRQRPNQAREVRVLWLAAESKRIPRDDSVAMLQLAEQYEVLLEDSKTALKLLLEAHQRRPESKDLAEALVRRGLSFQEGKWLNAEEIKGLPVDPIELAMREGRVDVGMSPEQVRKSLGRPAAITRIVTAGQVSEAWIYRDQGVNRVTVHFHRKSGRDGTSAKVVETY